MENLTQNQPEAPQPFQPSFWADPEKKLMIRQTGPAEAILLQILGRDVNGFFHHRHERISYPNPDRLQETLASLKPSDPVAWEDLMNEYLQVNKIKLELMNTYRQAQYEKGVLR
jgi:hypothetical protein